MVTVEADSMFWGLCLEAGGKYSQNVEKGFHLSMAAVDPHKCKGSEPITVFLQKNKVDYVLCTLSPGTVNQQQLDLNFSSGEDITFFVKEKGTVHLTGYLDDAEATDFDYDDIDSDSEEEELQEKMKQKSSGGKKRLHEFIDDEAEECSEEEDEDDMFEMTGDDDDFEDDDDLSMEEEPEPPKKKEKKEQKQKVEISVTEKSAVPTSPGEGKKKKKKKKNKNKEEKAPEVAKEVKAAKPAAEKPKKQMLKGGVIAEDIKEGHGPVATSGKKVKVYYTGRLLTNGKMFDSTTSGPPFPFKLGKKEVIPGWEVGLEGMKVGGKRRLTIPPNMAYGKEKMGGIPPNSTLTFEVELKSVA